MEEAKHVTSSISKAKCWRFIVEVPTPHLLGFPLGAGDRCPSQGNQQQRRQSKERRPLPGGGNTSVLKTAPARGQGEPTLLQTHPRSS